MPADDGLRFDDVEGVGRHERRVHWCLVTIAPAVLLGLIGTVALRTFLQGQSYEISALDPLVLMTISPALLAVAAAGVVPACATSVED